MGRFNPVEIRDQGMFAAPVTFQGTTFAANTLTGSVWRDYEVRFGYRYNLLHDSEGPWIAKVGASVGLHWLDIGLVQSGIPLTTTEDFVAIPTVHATVGVHLGRKAALIVEVDYIDFATDMFLDAIIYLRFQLSKQWNLNVGYRYINRIIDTDELFNDVEQNRATLTIGYAW